MGTLLQFPEDLAQNASPTSKLATCPADGDLALMLSMFVFSTLPADKKADLRNQLKMIDLGQGDPRAAAILDLIGRG